MRKELISRFSAVPEDKDEEEAEYILPNDVDQAVLDQDVKVNGTVVDNRPGE